MERDEAITRLPLVYQRVLLWLDRGWSDKQIAAALRIDVQAVDPLIRLARSKLARLTDDVDPDDELE